MATVTKRFDEIKVGQVFAFRGENYKKTTTTEAVSVDNPILGDSQFGPTLLVLVEESTVSPVKAKAPAKKAKKTAKKEPALTSAEIKKLRALLK
jgi:hypothetical protein